MAYSLLKQLIEHIDVYEQNSQSVKLEEFVLWLNGEIFGATNKKEHSEHDNLLIPFQIMLLNKDLKKKTKSVLVDSKISSIDEYSFLLHLSHQDSFRKMEIIELHNLEAPTGIEIIKRLLKNKLITEFADVDDKRAKRIKASKLGIKEAAKLEPQLVSIFNSFSEVLELGEKIQLAALLRKLNFYG